MLQQQRDREERRAAADAEALARLKQSYAAAKAAELGGTPGGAAGVLKAAAAELSLKPVDILRIFEAERANLQEAAALAAADAESARAQLARAQVRYGRWRACVASSSCCFGASCNAANSILLPAVAQEVLHAAGLPCEQFEELEGQARVAARRAAVAEERATAAEEEVVALHAELAERPTQVGLEVQGCFVVSTETKVSTHQLLGWAGKSQCKQRSPARCTCRRSWSRCSAR